MKESTSNQVPSSMTRREALEEEAGSGRLLSLDACRGFVMMTLVAGPLVLGIASRFDRYSLSRLIAGQFVHTEWAGCRLWDLLMPGFMIMVGLSLPFSYASRVRRGQSKWRIRAHVLKRSIVFVLLGLLISSRGEPQTRFVFQGLLTQFGLAYPWAFLLVGRRLRFQCLTVVFILIGYWLAFLLHPVPSVGFDFGSVGLPDTVTPFTDLFAHWNRGTNLAASFDLWFLNLFPRPEPYRHDIGGVQTLNFIPSIATMTIGVVAGEMLRSSTGQRAKLLWLIRWGALLLVCGLIAGFTVCPLVKAIWTPSWVLFSGGLTLLTMGGFFWAVEIGGWSKLVFPLTVVGVNSIAIYLLDTFSRPWLAEMVRIHFVDSWTAQEMLAISVLWLTCFWLYRRGIFLRI